MNPFRITTDLFILPDGIRGKKVIYAPCLGVVIDADKSVLNLLSDIVHLDYPSLSQEKKAIVDYFVQKGILNGADTFIIRNEGSAAEKLAIFPTNKCNLRCRYCYGGKYSASGKTMDIRTAIHAIRQHGNTLKENGRNRFILELHGGGEPFFEFELLREIVDFLEKYCRSENFIPEIAASTNGVLTGEKREWIMDHISSLLISFEGLPDIQNYHRPFPDNSPTFSSVNETINYFDRKKLSYSIRVTVSNRNLRLMKETIGFISANYGTRIVFLEPVTTTGNHTMEQDLACDIFEFGKEFLEAEKFARSRNIRTVYSGANIDRLSSHFCYVGTGQFAVTPDGYLTNCWEVTQGDHPQAETFIVGKINENGETEMYSERIAHLKTFSVDQLDKCRDCFAKWHCSGDCAMRSICQSPGQANEYRCKSNRYLMNQKLLSLLNNITT